MDIKELQSHWDAFGRTDPLFAILTADGKGDNRWDTEEFFDAGKREIDDLMKYLRSLNLAVPRKKALDFGCGVGRLTQSLAEHFDKACGVDIAPSMIQQANRFNRHGDKCRYFLNRSDNLQLFKSNEFDLIYSNITLQHMAPRYSEKYIKEFLRILSPQGLLVFQLPEAPVTIDRKTIRQSMKSILPPTALTAYRRFRYGKPKPVMQMYGIKKERMRNLLEAHGGEIVGIKEEPMGENGWTSYVYFVRKTEANICHLITAEYPPQPGGVSDHTRAVAAGLGAAGDKVHVWCPTGEGETPRSSGVFVHRELGRLAPSDFRRVGQRLNEFGGPRRLLVQWVPHAYGYRAMNLAFCVWLWWRAFLHRDDIELIVHEPFLSFGEGSRRQNLVAIVHRLMTVVLLNAVNRVWITIPAWEKRLGPYALGRRIDFDWLPVASNIPVVDDASSVAATRRRYANRADSMIGHFGTYDRPTTNLLLNSIPGLLGNGNSLSVLLLGRGSELMRETLINEHPELANRLSATGDLNSMDVSLHIKACDLMLQPYIDGVSSRRTSVMVGLAHGLPIVTTEGKLTEPLWRESGAVSLTPAGDVEKIVAATQSLLANKAERKRLAASARELYLKRFDIKYAVSALRSQTPNPLAICGLHLQREVA